MKKYICGVLLSMTFLTSLMAGAKEPVMFERVIHLPDTEMRFSITEDFSKDMPAAPFVEKVTADMLSGLKMPGDRFVIGRRWWDLKPQGLFKKSWGSMQMTVSIGSVVDLKFEKINLCDLGQKGFLGFYRESLVEKWKSHNEGVLPEDMLQYGIDISPLYSVRGKEYVPYFGYGRTEKGNIFIETATGHGAVIYYYFSFPVAVDKYLEFEFVGAPNVNGSPYLFQEQVRGRIKSITDSFLLSLREDRGCMSEVLGKWVIADSVRLLKPDSLTLPKHIPVDEI